MNTKNYSLDASAIRRGVLARLVCLGCVATIAGCGGPGNDEASIPLTVDDLPPVVESPYPKQTEPGPADEDAPEEFTETKSGLRYRVTRKSDGRTPTLEDQVMVHYHGTLDDGTVFDSTYEREEPAAFALDGVIQGWQEGLQLVGKGGMIELEIPADLGYGAQSKGKIPANSRLHFVVEILDIR